MVKENLREIVRKTREENKYGIVIIHIIKTDYIPKIITLWTYVCSFFFVSLYEFLYLVEFTSIGKYFFKIINIKNDLLRKL